MEAVVRDVAIRHGCTGEDVTRASGGDAAQALLVIRVRVARGFATERFALDLQATVHNLGGQLDPVEHRAAGTLAALEGTWGGRPWRVEVHGERPPPPPARSPKPTARPPVAAKPAPSRLPSVPSDVEPPSRLVIVLDDGGNSLEPLAALARLPRAVAVAVLPNTLHAAEFSRAAAGQGREVLLHLPMDPVAGNGPGPGDDAIGVGLSDHDIKERLERALAVVPGARGVNNHMGSMATADHRVMAAVMAVLGRRGLYFLDSRTTAATVAEDEALRHRVKALHRDVFLDNQDHPEAIMAAFAEAIGRARTQGEAVAIGHVHPTTLAALGEEIPRLPNDVRLVAPSQLLR